MMVIIACVDFSPVTEDVVKAAFKLALASNGHVHLLHVVQPIPIALGVETYSPAIDQLAGERVRIAREQLDALRDRHKGEGVETTTLLFEGLPAEHILREAVALKADLIVMGSHGFGILRRLFVGSTTLGVLKRASCPVVVVPSAIHRQPETPASEEGEKEPVGF